MAGPLELRTPTRDDLERALEWRNRPEVTRWLLRTTVDPEAYVAAWLAAIDDPDQHAVVAVVDGMIVGTGSLDVSDGMGQFDGDEWRRSEGLLGYLIDPAHAGKGYATDIARALLDLAFTELRLHRVTAACFADNRASWRVMEKLGMRREQHGVRDSWHAELGWVDGFTYAILADEWAGGVQELRQP
ncbi:GCN5 family acetyltransferase [Agromyces sp. Leaf222]|nr:GCN5 family acetyltransferase [Agromyces sp. Leaf222]